MDEIYYFSLNTEFTNYLLLHPHIHQYILDFEKFTLLNFHDWIVSTVEDLRGHKNFTEN